MSSTKFILRPGTYDKKHKARKPDKETSIYLQYSHKGEKILVLSGQKIEPKDWLRTSGKPRGDAKSKLSKTLEDFRRDFKDKAISAVQGEPEPAKVLEAWRKYKEEEQARVPEAVLKGSLLARWSEYLEYLDQALYKGRKRTQGTIRNNRNSRELLAKYLKEKKREAIKPEAFTLVDYQKFEAWLTTSPEAWVWRKNMPNEEERTKSPNGIAKTLKQLKSFLKWHIKSGGLVGFNLAEIEYSETAGTKISLTEKELVTIAQSELKGRLNLVRDLLVLQASTGVRISDLERLCSNLTEDKTAFKIKTKKARKPVLVPVLELAKQVLKRHHYKLPALPQPVYREGIKEIYRTLWPSKTIEIGEGDSLREAFIWEEISSHDLVRTFINIAWKKGISVPTIALITGKSIQVLLKNYLSEDQEFASKEMLEKFDLSPLRIAK